MITQFLGLKLNRHKKIDKQYTYQPAMVLKTLLSFSRTEVLSREEQITIFGKGYSSQLTKCSVYDPPSANLIRIS